MPCCFLHYVFQTFARQNFVVVISDTKTRVNESTEVHTLGAVQDARHAKRAALTLRMDVTCNYSRACVILSERGIYGSLLGKDGGLSIWLPICVSGSV